VYRYPKKIVFPIRNIVYAHTRYSTINILLDYYDTILVGLRLFFFTRCVFSNIIRLSNLIFQVIRSFRNINSNNISFSLRYFSLKILLKSVMSFLEFRCRYFFDLKKKSLKCLSLPEYTVYANSIALAGFPE